MKIRAYLYPGLLPPATCDALMHAGESAGLSKSQENNPDSQRRRSSAAWLGLTQEEEGVIQAVKKFASTELKLPTAHLERLQVQRYGPGDHYLPHFDAAGPRGRRRTATLLFYLSEPVGGGETVFPLVAANSSGRLHRTLQPQVGTEGDVRVEPDEFDRLCRDPAVLRVAPRRGDALLFFSTRPTDGEISPLSLHGSCPILGGEKWIAQQWAREAPVSPHRLSGVAGLWTFTEGEPAPELPSSPRMVLDEAGRWCAGVDLSGAAVSGSAMLALWVVPASCGALGGVTVTGGQGEQLLGLSVRDCRVTALSPTALGPSPPSPHKVIAPGEVTLAVAATAPGPREGTKDAAWGTVRWVLAHAGGDELLAGGTDRTTTAGLPMPPLESFRKARICVRGFRDAPSRMGRLFLLTSDEVPLEEIVHLGS